MLDYGGDPFFSKFDLFQLVIIFTILENVCGLGSAASAGAAAAAAGGSCSRTPGSGLAFTLNVFLKATAQVDFTCHSKERQFKLKFAPVICL